jgi:hypothetical protein
MAANHCYILGKGANKPTIDRGTNCPVRMPAPGVIHGNANLLDRTHFVWLAFNASRGKYTRDALVKHTSADFAEIVQGIVPGFIAAAGILVVSTGVGAGIGSLAGGVGAAPGAAAGFAVGLEILEALGLVSIIVYVKDRMKAVDRRFGMAIHTAWDSNGDPFIIDRAAHQFADATGGFFALVMEGVLAFAAKEGIAKASEVLGKTKYGRVLVEWLRRGKWRDNVQSWLDAMGQSKAPELMRTRLKTALDFVKNRRYGRDNLRFSEMEFDKEVNFVRGIDLHNDVRITKLRAGTEVIRYGEKGNFYTEVGTASGKLGFDATGKPFTRFTVAKDIDVLESTAAEFRMKASDAAEYAKSTGKYYGGRGRQYMIDNEAIKIAKLHPE